MGPIVCATRGGEASRRTQERAIALAKERNEKLIFLCVADPSFAATKDEALEATVKDELKRLGRSLLSIAQARAKREGVSAQTVIRSGPVWENIAAYLREIGASTLVIGAPKAEEGDSPLGVRDIQRFAEEVRQATGAEVIVVT